MLETIMICVSLPVVGLFELCFAAAFLKKLSFDISIKGWPVWVISTVFGWLTFKLIGFV